MKTQPAIPNAYLPYPHCQAFDAKGRLLTGLMEGGFALVDGSAGQVVSRCSFPGALIWPEVCPAQDFVAFSGRSNIRIIPLDEPASSLVCRPPGDFELIELISIATDGRVLALGANARKRQVLFEWHGLDGRLLREIALPSPDRIADPMTVNTDHPWNHWHYVPAAEDWIAFCNNSRTHRTRDRMWLWHPSKAPDGLVAFDQTLGTGEVQVFVGHERWAFHDFCAVVVAYMTSPARELAGVWMVFGDGRAPRLIIAHPRAMHCNISECGRFVVFDTYGRWDDPAPSREEWPDHISDIVVWDSATDALKQVARSHVGPAGPTPPHFPQHPHHPHPCFNPSATEIYFNDYDHAAGVACVRCLPNPFAAAATARKHSHPTAGDFALR